MDDADLSKLRQRTTRARDEVRRAHTLLAKGEPVAAAVEARKAAEHLLLIMLLARGLKPAGAIDSSLTSERIEQLLRDGGALPKGVADHARTVRAHGNRAAHPQASITNEVTEHDARVALGALDALSAWIARELPTLAEPAADPGAIAPAAEDVRPARRPAPAPPVVPPTPAPGSPWLRRLVGLVLLGGLACAAPLLGFFVAIGALGVGGPPAREVEPLPSEPSPPAAPADLEPEVAPLPALEARDRREALQLQVQNELVLTPDALAGLGCDELARVRNTLWLRHGYLLRDEVERALHGPVTAATLPGAAAPAIRKRFTAADETNLTVIEAVLDRERCPCPMRGRPNHTCPD